MATIRKRGQSWQVHRKLYAVGCQLRDFAKRAHMLPYASKMTRIAAAPLQITPC